MTNDQLLKQFHAKQIKFKDGLQVLKPNRNTIDVFTGDGWSVHSRYRLVKGKWLHVNGAKLNNSDLSRATNEH